MLTRTHYPPVPKNKNWLKEKNLYKFRKEKKFLTNRRQSDTIGDNQTQSETMMTLEETMVFNNMTNVIKNLEQCKSISDIINDLNELMLTLRARNHNIIDEPEQVEHEPKQEIKAEQVEHVPKQETKAEQVEHVHKQTKTEHKTVTKAEPVQKKEKAGQVKKKTKAPTPGRGKIECRCGLMICNAAMSRHEKGSKHKEAMAKKEKTEMKQAEGQTLGLSDMDLVDIETYMKVMLPRLYNKVRGLGGQVHNNEKFGFMKIEGDRDKIIDTMYNIVMPDVNRKLANALPRKFDELMNSSKKYNRYESIYNKSYEAYKTKNKYVYFIIISKSNEVYLTTYEPKQIEELENLDVYDDERINELYEKEKNIFDEEIEKFNKEIFG